MVDILLALTELSSLSVTVPELRGEICTVRLFSQTVDLFVLKFYLDSVVPISRSWHQKTTDTALRDGKHCSLVRSLVFHTIPECDGQMDGQTDGYRRICCGIYTLCPEKSNPFYNSGK